MENVARKPARRGRTNRRVTSKLPGTKPVRPARRRPRTRKEWALWALKWGAIASLAMAAIMTLVVALVFWRYGSDPTLPKISSLGDYEPHQVTRVAAADGRIVGELFTERRIYVPYEQVPPLMVEAFIAAEDASFFSHQGIDYWGMVRALFVNVRSRKTKQGASTITQQVVKTFLLTPERTFRRKIQEIILARRLESALSKEEILTLYLNQIYFGHGRYGVQEAARFYFGKDVSQLDVGEAAMIAGLPQAPEHISPKRERNAARAKARQTYVLEQMVHRGYITEDVARKHINAPIRVVADPFPEMNTAPEWVDLVRVELVRRYGDEGLDRMGGVITTTLDLDAQAAAVTALREGLHELDKRLGYGVPFRRVKPDQIGLEVARLTRRLPKDGPGRGEVHPAVVLEVHDDDGEMVVDLGGWKASVMLGGVADARFNPEDKKPSARFAPGNVVRVWQPRRQPLAEAEPASPRHTDRAVELAPGPEGAVVVIDPHSREVLAMVGGYRTRVADFNRATMARRQPGSAFKPFVYAAAIETGEMTAASIINDAPEVYNLWKPENYERGEFAGPVRLRVALARSINTVAIRVLHDVGPERGAELARRMGIESQLPTTLSLALGSGEVTPLELTNAYATFAAAGKVAPPRFISAIDGERLEPEPAVEALRPEAAFVLVDMMRSVVEEGTAGRARALRLPVSGKTGTSNDARDGWFIGMTPNLVVGVWVGFDDNRGLGRGEGGSRSALPIYVKVMEALGARDRARSYARPPGVVEARLDKATGLLAPAGAKAEDVYTEVFLEGTVPVETAPAPGQVDGASFVLDRYDDLFDAYEETPPDPGGSADDAR